MLFVFYVCAALLALKLLWNLIIPISVTFFWSKDERKNRGVSLAPIEFLILLVITALSFFDERLSILGVNGFALFGVGVIAIVATYVFIYIFLWLFKGRFSD
ncbi:hypothetical protein [Microbulbifer sp. PSTR4-B]|uniref:hypothetical protein n=1 Tax=Microbulbifer sp. PSTR4-B TaxID=3243396 RepID=UPI00403A1228